MNSDAGTSEASSNDLQALMTAWLDCFVSAAREKDAPKLKGLFHPDAILFGTENGGCVDWPIPFQFSFDRDHARIFPNGPYVLCVVDWSMNWDVGDGCFRKGHATFFCALKPKDDKFEFLCAHAHFSRI